MSVSPRFVFALALLSVIISTSAHAGGTVAIIEGKVTFAQRKTFIPLFVCRPPAKCPAPTPYWALVVQTPTMSIELDQRFAPGSETEPALLEIAQVPVRVGYRISLEAELLSATGPYGFVSQPRNVMILDQGTDTPVYFGWSCHSDREQNPVFYANVLRTGEPEAPLSLFGETSEVVSALFAPEAQDDHYRMRVSAFVNGDKPQIVPLANVERAKASLSGRRLSYKGISEHSSVELQILQTLNREEKGLSSRLQISRDREEGDRGFTQLWCLPTRVRADGQR